MLPAGCVGVSLDVMATLMRPKGGVGAVYTAEAVSLLGADHRLAKLSPEDVDSEFKVAFKLCRKEWGNPSTIEATRQFWDYAVRKTFQPDLPVPSQWDPSEHTDVNLSALSQHLYDRFSCADAFEAFGRVEETLAVWKNQNLSIVAVSNTDYRIKSALEQFGWYPRYLSHVVTATDGLPHKPAPAGILWAAEQALKDQPHFDLKETMRRWVHIGDEEVDRLAAEAAGCSFVHSSVFFTHP